jgi:hypothetical protein
MNNVLPEVRPPRLSRIIMPISYALACAIIAVVAFTLWEARQDAWTEAERYGRSITQVLRNDIARNIELYDLSLQRLRDATVNPDVASMAPRVGAGRCSIEPRPAGIWGSWACSTLRATC